jgi:hypothetical protein
MAIGLNRWQLYDAWNNQYYTLSMNPNEGGTPLIKKNVQREKTSTGKPLWLEGRDELLASEVKGTFRDRYTYDAFQDWLTRPRRIQVTDDLGRSFKVVFTEFTPERKPTRSALWRSAYTIRYQILQVLS